MAPSAKYPLLSYQPFRLLYQLLGGLTILLCAPAWAVMAAVPSLRPHPSWTFKQALMARLTRALVDVYSRSGITETHTLLPGKEGERFQTVEPFAAELYAGPLACSSDQDVRPAVVGGTWYPAKPDGSVLASGSATVVLQLHGGAFVMGDGRTGYSGFMAGQLTDAAGADAVFVPQYRLSGYGGANPFPAALQDALTAYLYLTRSLGIPASRVVLCGDSAGGNLAVALLRYLEAHGDALGLERPACAVLIAPWVNPPASLGPDAVYTAHETWATDLLPVSFLRWGARTYADGVPDEYTPYVVPLGNPFSTPVPLFVSLGEFEMLRPDGADWVAQMEAAGARVSLLCEDKALHDTLLLGGNIGWEDSARRVAEKIGEFLAHVRESGAGTV